MSAKSEQTSSGTEDGNRGGYRSRLSGGGGAQEIWHDMLLSWATSEGNTWGSAFIGAIDLIGVFRGENMLTRRVFIASSFCAAHAVLNRTLANAEASSQYKQFICGTADRLLTVDSSMQIERYSADAGFDSALLQSLAREFKLTPYGTASFVTDGGAMTD